MNVCILYTNYQMLEILIAKNYRSCEIKKQRKIKTIIISVTFFTWKYDAFIIKKKIDRIFAFQ